MPIQTDSLNRKLYDLLDSRGYDPVPMDADVSKAGKTVAPEEADVFKFTFKRGDKPIDTALVSIDGANKLTLYYDEELSKEGSLKTADTDIDDSWFGFLKFLKKWAFSKRLSWELAPKHKIDSDMAQRTYMKKKEQIAEGYYPMGKMSSYNDNIPTVKIVLQHTRQIQEGEQRYRNVARIFLENTHGERILAPTTKPGIAQIYARHLAEGGVPNDERWNHIKSLCEEYSKMAGFVRAVRGNQFNESAQRLVEAGLNHYQNLRESLGKMRGHRGYNAYFESWTPTLMETEGDESNLNELFVQETLDPRIESVMPILSKLKLNLGEMKEVTELAEWAENLTELEKPMPITPEEYREKMKALQRIQLDPDTSKDPLLKKELIKRIAQLKLRARNNPKITTVVEQDIEDMTEAAGAWEGEGLIKGKYYLYNSYSDSFLSDPDNLSSPQTFDDFYDADNVLGHMGGQQMDEYGIYQFDGINLRYAISDEELEDQPTQRRHLNRDYAKMDRADSPRPQKQEPMFKKHTRAELETIARNTLPDLLGRQPNDLEVKYYANELWQSENETNESITQGVAEGSEDYQEIFQMNTKQGKVGAVVQYKDKSFGFIYGTQLDPRKFDRAREAQQALNVHHDKQGVAEGEIEDAEKAHQKINTPAAFRKAKGGDWKVTGQDLETAKARTGTSPEGLAAIKKLAGLEEPVKESKDKTVTIKPENEQELVDWLESEGFDIPESTTDDEGNLVYDFRDMDHSAYIYASDFDIGSQEADDDFEEQGVAEDLDANQKRVGQLGPTEKVKNNNIGKLVGANESVEKDVTEGSVSKEKQKTPYRDINSPESRAAAEKQRQQMAKDKAAEPGKKLLGKIANKGVSEGLNEMDKSQPSSDRGGESSGDPYAKGGKATPVKTKDMDKDAEKELNKAMDKAHKKDVKEGQEDLDAILRIIRK